MLLVGALAAVLFLANGRIMAFAAIRAGPEAQQGGCSQPTA